MLIEDRDSVLSNLWPILSAKARQSVNCVSEVAIEGPHIGHPWPTSQRRADPSINIKKLKPQLTQLKLGAHVAFVPCADTVYACRTIPNRACNTNAREDEDEGDIVDFSSGSKSESGS